MGYLFTTVYAYLHFARRDELRNLAEVAKNTELEKWQLYNDVLPLKAARRDAIAN